MKNNLGKEIIISAVLIVAALIGTFSVFAEGSEHRNDEWHCIEYQSDTMIEIKIYRNEENVWVGYSSCKELVDRLLHNGSGFIFLDRETQHNLNKLTQEIMTTYESWILTKSN